MQLVVLFSLVALAAAAPQISHPTPPIKLVSQYFNQDGKGNYDYGYLLSNNQRVDEVGQSFPGPKPETGSISKEGSFEFVLPNGQNYHIDYIAGEGGFQPQGLHLPTPPPQLPEYAQLQQKHPELFV